MSKAIQITEIVSKQDNSYQVRTSRDLRMGDMYYEEGNFFGSTWIILAQDRDVYTLSTIDNTAQVLPKSIVSLNEVIR